MIINVIKNEKINSFIHHISFKNPGIDFKPCHFVNIKTADVFLRRPFSVFHSDSGSFSILVKIIGKGTERISMLKKGENVDVLMPLGKPYVDEIDYDEMLFIAGGIGIAGINKFIDGKQKYNLIFGDRECEYENILDKFEIKAFYVNEKAGFENKGTVVDYIDKFKFKKIIACGPFLMFKEISNRIKENIDFYAVCEEIMACGVGLCNGCAVKMKNNSFKRVCVDGPLLNGRDINYDEY